MGEILFSVKTGYLPSLLLILSFNCREQNRAVSETSDNSSGVEGKTKLTRKRVG